MSDDANPPAEPAAPEPAAQAEPAAPDASQGGAPVESAPPPPAPAEAPVATAEAPAEVESTHLPANESISETAPEAISEPSHVQEPVEIPVVEDAPKPAPAASIASAGVTPAPARDSRSLLARANTARQTKKQKNLDAIVAELEKRGTISNNGVQKLLKCSNATAIRYLSMLVKQGKIIKKGKGRGVVYVRA